MAGPHPWQNLRTVMIITVHVAAVSYLLRSLANPNSISGSLTWVPVAISVAVFLSWPLSRVIMRAFDPELAPVARTCPRCGRSEVRPLLRGGRGLFQPASAFRCAACWLTIRTDGLGWLDGQATPPDAIACDPTGIDFLDDPGGPGEIRFLDETAAPDPICVVPRTSESEPCRDV